MNQHDMTRNMVLAALFAALTAIGAFLQIPTGTVPLRCNFCLPHWPVSCWGGSGEPFLNCFMWASACWACRSLRRVAASAMCSSPASAFCWG